MLGDSGFKLVIGRDSLGFTLARGTLAAGGHGRGPLIRAPAGNSPPYHHYGGDVGASAHAKMNQENGGKFGSRILRTWAAYCGGGPGTASVPLPAVAVPVTDLVVRAPPSRPNKRCEKYRKRFEQKITIKHKQNL